MGPKLLGSFEPWHVSLGARPTSRHSRAHDPGPALGVTMGLWEDRSRLLPGPWACDAGAPGPNGARVSRGRAKPKEGADCGPKKNRRDARHERTPETMSDTAPSDLMLTSTSRPAGSKEEDGSTALSLRTLPLWAPARLEFASLKSPSQPLRRSESVLANHTSLLRCSGALQPKHA